MQSFVAYLLIIVPAVAVAVPAMIEASPDREDLFREVEDEEEVEQNALLVDSEKELGTDCS